MEECKKLIPNLIQTLKNLVSRLQENKFHIGTRTEIFKIQEFLREVRHASLCTHSLLKSVITAVVIDKSQTTLFEFLPPETLLYFYVFIQIDIYAFIPIEFYASNT